MVRRVKSFAFRPHDDKLSRTYPRFVLFGMILSARHAGDWINLAAADRRPSGSESE